MRSKYWQLTEWRKRRKDFIKDKKCEWCGSTEKLCIHHPQARGSLSDEVYTSFEGCITLCKRCHFAFHKGLHLCPVCKKNYAKRGYSQCFGCLPEETKISILKHKEEFNKMEAHEIDFEEFCEHPELDKWKQKLWKCENCNVSIDFNHVCSYCRCDVCLKKLEEANEKRNITLLCGKKVWVDKHDMLPFYGCHDHCPKGLEGNLEDCVFCVKEYSKDNVNKQ